MTTKSYRVVNLHEEPAFRCGDYVQVVEWADSSPTYRLVGRISNHTWEVETIDKDNSGLIRRGMLTEKDEPDPITFILAPVPKWAYRG